MVRGIGAVALSLFISISSTQACEPKAVKDSLQALLSRSDFSTWAAQHLGGVSLDSDAVLVAWDHQHDLWSVYDWTAKVKTVTARPGKVKLADGKLQIAAPTGQNVLMFVTNTNPLVYGAKASAITTTDTAEVAELKKLAGLLGSAATALFKASGGAISASGEPECVFAGNVKQTIGCVAKAVLQIQQLSRNIDFAHSRAIAYIQVVELGEESLDDLAEVFGEEGEETSTAIRDVDSAFRDLTRGRKALLDLQCKALWEAGDAAEKFFETETDATKRKEKLDALKKTLVDCPAGTEVTWQAAADDLLAAQPERMNRLALTLGVYTRSGELVDKRQPLFKTAAWLRDLKQTAQRYGGPDFDHCNYIDGLVAVRGGSIEAVLDKQNSGGFNLTASLPTTDFITTHVAPAEKKIDVTSTTRWGLGVGLIYTDLEENTWKAVPDPTDATKKVIGKPSSNSRAGQLALLANLRPGWATFGRNGTYGLQFGAGTDTDKPSLFLGASVDLGRWFRIGAGQTWQRVKVLSSGQEELKTVVADDAAIRTRDAFRNDFYLSLSISLDGIPLFESK